MLFSVASQLRLFKEIMQYTGNITNHFTANYFVMFSLFNLCFGCMFLKQLFAIGSAVYIFNLMIQFPDFLVYMQLGFHIIWMIISIGQSKYHKPSGLSLIHISEPT